MDCQRAAWAAARACAGWVCAAPVAAWRRSAVSCDRPSRLPVIAPTLATLAVFSVIAGWSNLLWPLIVLQERENFTLPVAVNQLLGVFSTNQRYAYAGAVLAVLPVVLFFLAAQRYVKAGMLAGSVKG